MIRKSFSILFLWLCAMGLMAQTDGYDPVNPPNPEVPAVTYLLVTSAQPAQAGSANVSGSKYTAGSSVYVYTYNNNGYVFKHWTDGTNIVSTSSSFYYTMPAANTRLTAVYEYDPASPDNPSGDYTKPHTLALKASPSQGGYFNYSSNQQFKQGQQLSLYAYSNNNYQFKHWEYQGKIVSTDNRYYYTMPDVNVELVAVFEYNPASPQDPGTNSWNPETGELIMDAFQKDNLSNAIYNVTGGNTDDVQSLIVNGEISDYDIGNVEGYNFSVIDFSRCAGATYVPSWSFESNTTLTSISLPSSITSIGYYSFYNCESLTSVSCYATVPPTLESYVFEGIKDNLVIFVPAESIDLYQEANGWKDLTILPLQSQVNALEVNLPAGSEDGRFKNMFIELVNTNSGQRMRYVISDRTAYTFQNLMHNTKWNVYVKNAAGQVLGQMENIEMQTSDRSVTFQSLIEPQTIKAVVKTPDGTDVTNQISITWMNPDGSFLGKEPSVSGILPIDDAAVILRATLPQALAMQYQMLADTTYVVQDSENVIKQTLTVLPTAKLKGLVRDVLTNVALEDATVTVSQTLNGKYSKAFTAITNAQGVYNIDAFDAPTSITAVAADYISKTVQYEVLPTEEGVATLEDITLKSINGAIITVGFTYTQSAVAGTQGESQEYYADYQNVAYTIRDITAGRDIREFNVQYPQIVLLEDVDLGDSLQLTATSKTGAFLPVVAKGQVDELNRASVTFNIKQLGQISATFVTTENPTVNGILYDAKGKFVKKGTYSNASLSFKDLTDGDYTLVTMGNSKLFSTIYDLNKFSQAGLVDGTDYVTSKVTVKSGVISTVKMAYVPFFDESKLYYTGDNTSFTVNKTQITAGNYLTLNGRIDFKSLYVAGVSDVKLIVDMPESCSLVDNSVMVGNSLATYLSVPGRVTIPVTTIGERIRFCIIPTAGGDYAPSASVQFTYNGQEVTQPIGQANFAVKDLSITVPSVVATPAVPISGTTVGKSQVEIYDGTQLIGTTSALANGQWATSCELKEPSNLSKHSIFAKVTTPNGLEMQSEMKSLLYDTNAIKVSKVCMYHWNPEMNKNYEIVFDFISPSSKAEKYIYYIYNRQFTFTIDFTVNDTTKIDNVYLDVKLGNGTWSKIPATFDKKKGKWVATSEFGNMYDGVIPVNVAVCYNSLRALFFDRDEFTAKEEAYDVALNDLKAVVDSFEVSEQHALADSLHAEERHQAILDALQQLDELTGQETLDNDALNLIVQQILELSGNNIGSEPEDQVYTDIDNLLAQGEALLSAADEVDIEDYIVGIQDLVGSCDSLLNIKDALTLDELAFTETDSIYFEIEDTPMCLIKKDMSSFDLQGINEEYLDTLELTDGSQLLIYINEYDFAIIDKQNNVVWSAYAIVENNCKPFRALANRRIKAVDILAALQEAIESINEVVSKIKVFVDELASPIRAEIKYIESSIATLGDKRLDLLSKSSAKAIRVRALNNQLNALNNSVGFLDLDEIGRVEAQRTRLLLERRRLLVEISDLDKEAANLGNRLSKLKNSRILKVSLLATILEYYNIASNIVHLATYAREGIQDYRKWSAFIDGILPCPEDVAAATALVEKSKGNRNQAGGLYLAAVGVSTISNGVSIYLTANKAAKFLLKLLGSFVTDFLNHTAKSLYENAKNTSKNNYIHRKAERKRLKCKKDDDDDDDGQERDESGSSDSDPSIDPSGYVYEGVPSNRLQGVTATCYYKETGEDMYGDPYEKEVLWNAEEYAQENPLFTDENGFYRWDVPQGLWRVKFEKEGYQTTYSEWLPVPPPQLDVNIAMTQARQPEVKEAKAYEDGVEVEFDKYMLPENLTTDNIIVKKNGEKIDGTIQLLNSESTDEDNEDGPKLASRVKFATPEGVQLLSTDEVTVIVTTSVKSYAGVPLQETYSQTFDVEKAVRKIAADSLFTVLYEGTRTLQVAALPADAAVGKTLRVRALSTLIADISGEGLTPQEDGTAIIKLNDEGQATLTVSGELPGSTALQFSIDDTKITGQTLVKVDKAASLVTPNPRASRASGSAVYRGTLISLSCENENAKIWYTLDGTCPCDPATALVYSKPIAINDDAVTIKAMAQAEGFEESEVVIFEYTAKQNTQELALSEGWTWISHNVATNLTLDKFSEKTLEVKSQTRAVIRDEVLGLFGNLTELIPTEAYKVKMSEAAKLAVSGDAFNATKGVISLSKGWNWIGYPMDQIMTPTEALTNLSASEGDMLVGLSGSADYIDGEWIGDLEVMTPGLGYMLKTGASSDLLYNTSIVSKAASQIHGRLYINNTPWSVDEHAYSNVMPMRAQLYREEALTDDDEFTVAAFNGTECRGIGKYVKGVIFMNVHGEGSEDITFLAAHNEKDYIVDIQESLSFQADAVGSYRAPIALHLGDETVGVEERYSQLGVWPTLATTEINVSLGGKPIERLTLTSADGRMQRIQTTGATQQVVNVSNLPAGIYIVAAQSGGEYFYKKIMKVNN